MSSNGEPPIRDAIAAAIRQDIVTGKVRPAERLREEEIARAHNVSRQPVREALRLLEGQGFVTLTPFRGATVATPSPRAGLEVLQVRRALEIMAARLAAQRRGWPLGEELEDTVRKGRTAAKNHRLAQLPPLIARFHELVADASGNAELQEYLAAARSKAAWVFDMDLEERAESSWEDHAAILEAILRGDESSAARLMDHHVSKDEKLYAKKQSQGSRSAAYQHPSTRPPRTKTTKGT